MNKRKIIGNILFIATLCSPIIAFSVATMVGEPDIFGTPGMLRYTWIMWFFIPVGVFSFIVGILLKRNNQKYKKNFIVAFICIPLLILFGSYRFLFAHTVSYDAECVVNIEEKTNIDLPQKVKVATNIWTDYSISYVKITSQQEERTFEEDVQTNPLWVEEISTFVEGILSNVIEINLEDFDYFMFYNVTNNEYNQCPNAGDYMCIFMAYNVQKNRLGILNDYKFTMI